LTAFNYYVGSGPSSEQTFTVSASNLVGDLYLTGSTNYEVSAATGSGFASSIQITPTSGSISGATIYVRLKAGLSVGSYNSEIITLSATGATSKTLTASGNVNNLAPTILFISIEHLMVSFMDLIPVHHRHLVLQ
jgi:hypothetical protein